MTYGLPYMGSKRKIADDIIRELPRGEVLVDLFAGGCAITHCALLSGKWKRVIANDVSDVVRLFGDAVAGKYRDESRWISREDFFRLKDSDPYVRYCWSFGNNGVGYIYGREIEPYKRAVHNAVMYDDWTEFSELCPEIADACKAQLSVITDTKLRRIWIGRAAVRWLTKHGTAEMIENNPLYNSCYRKSDKQSLQSLERLESLQSLQSLERLQSLESLQGWRAFELSQKDYRDVEIPAGAIVYCDPPYKGTAEYIDAFDHAAFYDWLRSRDFPVYVSEYSMPEDFVKVWGKMVKSKFSATNNSTAAPECLYLHERWLHKRKPVPVQLQLFSM